ncbi:MAG TPA: SRPBCC family protein [Nitrospirales bacterium]|nr:SRPBCC family protein [Nitrospirales bacterium]
MKSTNIGALEQILSLGIGCGLIVHGLGQQPRRGILPLLFGSGLVIHGLTSHSRLYEAIGIDELHGSHIRHPLNRTVHLRESITINRSQEDLYSFWRDFKNLPRFMQNIVAVQELDERHSRWQARGPFNKNFHWEAEILEERQNELIKWRTIEIHSNLEHEGVLSLRRAAGNRGTILSLDCRWTPPGGVFGATMAKLLPDDPARQVSEDLRRFRQLMEAGEISRNQHTSADSNHSELVQKVREVGDELGITDPVVTDQRP